MHCTYDRKVVKLNGDAITSYAGYSKRNFKKDNLTPRRFSINVATIIIYVIFLNNNICNNI